MRATISLVLAQIDPATHHVVRSIGRTSTAQGGPKLDKIHGERKPKESAAKPGEKI